MVGVHGLTVKKVSRQNMNIDHSIAIVRYFEVRGATDVISFHGDTTLTLKQWTTQNFCRQINESSFDIRLLTVTESAECGIDSKECIQCISVGSSTSLAGFSQ